MAKKKRKYYSGKELLYRRQMERQKAEEEEKTNNIRIRQLHQINAAWVVKYENRKKYEQEDKEE